LVRAICRPSEFFRSLKIDIPLKCFHCTGGNMKRVDVPFEWIGGKGDVVAFADVYPGSSVERILQCLAK